MSSRAHHWARGGVGQQAHRANPGAEQLESASARHSAVDRFRERERLHAIDGHRPARDDRVDLRSVLPPDELAELGCALFMDPVDLDEQILAVARGIESVEAWRRKPENGERLRAGEAELAAAVERAREACEGRR